MPLLSLPNELLEIIAQKLRSDKNINALARTNRHLYNLLNPFLYRHNAAWTGKRKGRRMSALLWAAAKGQEATCQLALANGANIHAKNRDGQPPLIIAAQHEQLEIIRFLLAREDGDVNTAQETITDMGAGFISHGYETPLIVAATNGYTEIVEFLLAQPGINVNDTGGKGHRDTALTIAALLGNTSVVEQLLAHKDIDVNLGNKFSITALAWAAINGNKPIVELLLARGDVAVNKADWQFGITPLQAAASAGHDEIVELLLTREDIDINVMDLRGRTALDTARQECKTRAIELLLAHGAGGGSGGD